MPAARKKAATYAVTSEPPRRKGAVRMSEIPPEVLKGLNEGRLETITLVEWLAIDIRSLARSIIPQVGLASKAAEIQSAAEHLASQGVERRSRGMGAALHRSLETHSRRREIFEALATHPSDMVRAWAGYIPAADITLTLAQRLASVRRFAADSNMAVRECAWSSFRAFLVADLESGISLLRPWVADSDPNIRRCAVEATRPRGVWTAHITELREHPERALVLLEPVRSDESRYVQNAVANWLNDASKSRPAWVRGICARWKRESPTVQTASIVKRALRTLNRETSASERAPRMLNRAPRTPSRAPRTLKKRSAASSKSEAKQPAGARRGTGRATK